MGALCGVGLGRGGGVSRVAGGEVGERKEESC